MKLSKERMSSLYLMKYFCTFVLLISPASSSSDSCSETRNQKRLGPGDKSPETFAKWWEEFQSWREEASANINMSIYYKEELTWARTSFIQPQLMIHDRYGLA